MKLKGQKNIYEKDTYYYNTVTIFK